MVLNSEHEILLWWVFSWQLLPIYRQPCYTIISKLGGIVGAPHPINRGIESMSPPASFRWPTVHLIARMKSARPCSARLLRTNSYASSTCKVFQGRHWNLAVAMAEI